MLNSFINVEHYTSKDGNLKAVLKYDIISTYYEIDFYKDGVIISSESYVHNSRRYHEDVAENYVNGIKKI